MTTLERARIELEKRRQEEKNMLEHMYKEIEINNKHYKEYLRLIGEQYE